MHRSANLETVCAAGVLQVDLAVSQDGVGPSICEAGIADNWHVMVTACCSAVEEVTRTTDGPGLYQGGKAWGRLPEKVGLRLRLPRLFRQPTVDSCFAVD
eukprot:COSAG03_NODE_17445_length_375_cov_0.938406_1_plen_100_part_00